MSKVLIIAKPDGASGLTWANKMDLEEGIASIAEDVNEVARAVADCGYQPLAFTPGEPYHHPFLDKNIKTVSVAELVASLPEISCVVLVGMVAKAGTLNAFMDGSINMVGFRDYFINGRDCGIIGMYKTYFSQYNIPIVFVSGDEAACKEAEEEMEGVKTVAVKRAVCRNRAIQIEGAKQRLYEVCVQALKTEHTPCEPLPLPITVRVVYTRTEYCADAVRWCGNSVTRIDARTLERRIEKINNFHTFTLSGL